MKSYELDISKLAENSIIMVDITSAPAFFY